MRTVIGRTVRVSRPSIRGSPFKIWLRTVLASKLKNSVLILLASSVDVFSVINSPNTRCLISSNFAERSPLALIWKAAFTSAAAMAATFSINAVSGSGATQSQASLLASAASSLIIAMTGCMASWPKITAPSMTSSDNSFASDSTIMTAVSVAPITKSNSVSTNCDLVGLIIYSSLI